ncbi:hypothetical protein A1O1_00113 [Capronia coronata CBS 617.96]|uniref:Glyoxalase-like domain-containing protein n=1 Tax=Capronia coronata CBS 617.96 TaxID=1182541 RepID=W9YZ90_9EURO|nr:uncharacterized protein A1O1_00113 [Capronia coronata CBS 617.96]EXJ94995.1 hypothetical protein A1O1_00113 [Capronia coronata CBS 617.96]
MSPDISEYSHDHVILLLDTADFENPPAWLSDNFNLIEGGVHAGGSSRNKLIIFADGTYIELLNWIAEPKEFFDWAGKPPGLIDFALTTPQSAQETHAAVTKRLQSKSSSSSAPTDPGDGGLGVHFKQPLFGGRRRKDGKQVEWYVTKPMFDTDAPNVPKPIDQFFPTGRLDVPFFCHDVTDRLLRVPYKAPSDMSVSAHPCGARGISSVEVLVPEAKFDSYVALYTAITGARPVVQEQNEDGTELTGKSAVFKLSLPNGGEESVRDLKGKVGIELRTPRDSEDEAWLTRRGVGIRAVRLFVEDEVHDAGERPLDSDGIGASLLLVANV